MDDISFTLITKIKNTEKSTVNLLFDEEKQIYVIEKIFKGNFDIYEKISKLNSSFFPKIYSVKFQDNKTHILEEYIEGNSLAKVKASEEQLSIWFSEICRGLELLHKNNIIHRDIKPSNLLLGTDGHIRIIDFDISREHNEDSTTDTRFLGTRGYAPPEQYGHSQTDTRADIYSLGVTLKELLQEKSSRYPYKKIIEKCTNFNPSKRFSSAKSLRLTWKYRNITAFVFPIIATVILAGFLGFFITKLPETSPDDISVAGTVSAELSTQNTQTTPLDFVTNINTVPTEITTQNSQTTTLDFVTNISTVPTEITTQKTQLIRDKDECLNFEDDILENNLLNSYTGSFITMSFKEIKETGYCVSLYRDLVDFRINLADDGIPFVSGRTSTNPIDLQEYNFILNNYFSLYTYFFPNSSYYNDFIKNYTAQISWIDLDKEQNNGDEIIISVGNFDDTLFSAIYKLDMNIAERFVFKGVMYGNTNMVYSEDGIFTAKLNSGEENTYTYDIVNGIVPVSESAKEPLPAGVLKLPRNNTQDPNYDGAKIYNFEEVSPDDLIFKSATGDYVATSFNDIITDNKYVRCIRDEIKYSIDINELGYPYISAVIYDGTENYQQISLMNSEFFNLINYINPSSIYHDSFIQTISAQISWVELDKDRANGDEIIVSISNNDNYHASLIYNLDINSRDKFLFKGVMYGNTDMVCDKYKLFTAKLKSGEENIYYYNYFDGVTAHSEVEIPEFPEP